MKQIRSSHIAYAILFSCLLAIFCTLPVFASAQNEYIRGDNYVLPEDSNFDYSSAMPKAYFFYGAKSLGELHINGSIENVTTYNGYPSFGATGDLCLRYDYNGQFQKTEDEKWHIEGDGTRWLLGYDLGLFHNIGSGCIMIERSQDASNWEKVIDPIQDYFSKSKTSAESQILSIPESDYKNGSYYRVIVAYKFVRQTKAAFLGNEYAQKKCVEVYEFFVSSENNYVTIQDIAGYGNLETQGSTDAGFVIHKNGSTATVSVNGKECNDYDYFIDPNEYQVKIQTTLGKEYKYKITVSNGMNFTQLAPKVHTCEKDKGFQPTARIATTCFGANLTSLSLANPKGCDIVQDVSSYGITGDSISLYLRLNYHSDDLGYGWILNSDNWGARKEQLVAGVETGEVGHGALIIQTSSDGKVWNSIDNGRYEKGLYTTDYPYHYGKDEQVLIYTPSGKDVLNGIHIKVLFAYQVKNPVKNELRDYIEIYQFYLCSNELGAVTFHNLSVADTLKDSFTDADQTEIEVYQHAETLIDGSYTTTGFQIDKSGNPTVQYTVQRNGIPITVNQEKYNITGKYDITLTSAVGSTRELSIYVDRMEPQDAMKRYFGEGFIAGKRIYSEGEYPVFEGGKINYNVASVNEYVLPLYGEIRNLTTGSVITVEQTPDEKSCTISEPGNYQAVLATSESIFSDELAGDARVFTFNFSVIAEGAAPGPIVNQRLLEEYSHTTAADSNPVYYGLTYLSAEKGKITLAFASKEAAFEYAYKVEEGLVEKQENGDYRYSGTFVIDQNAKYDSTWDLTKSLNYFAEAAIHKHVFDMSDEFTYLTLTDEDLEIYPNLRQLELPKSVTIFGEDQKEKLTDIDSLPLLNDKPYAYLDPATGEENRGFYSFEFITDQYGGIDSNSVVITDSQGTQHSIRYLESVGQQLLADNCPSGIVTIHEETMYGDVSEYQAIYIAPNDNQTSYTLEYSLDGEKEQKVIANLDAGISLDADSFKIADLRDPLDPYAFVIIKHDQTEEAFTARESIDTEWSGPGIYSITCLNRMGYGYSITMTIPEREEPVPVVEITAAPTPTLAPTPTCTIESINTPHPEQAEVASTEAAITDSTVESKQQSTQAPVDRSALTDPEPEQKETNETKQAAGISPIVPIAAVVILVAILAAFIYKRIRLFSRTLENLKDEGEDKHE